MALSNTHSLGTGVSYLDDTQLIAELLKYEDNIPVPYADGKGIATIGIGVNLTVPRLLPAFLLCVRQEVM